ncbi:MAG: A24 family peptidase [Bacteroidota bacterium]
MTSDGIPRKKARPSALNSLWARRNTWEALTLAALFGAVLGVLAPSHAAEGVLLAFLAGATLFDLRTGLIPNALTLAATLFALVAWLTAPSLGITPMVSGLSAALSLWVLRIGSAHWLGTPGFGMGDVKLAFPLGIVLGWSALWALYLAVVLAAMVAVPGLLSRRLARRSQIPFAPFMLGGVLLSYALPLGRVLDWIALLML